MTQKFQRGANDRHEMNDDWLTRDTRSTATKISDFILDGNAPIWTLAALSAGAFLAPPMCIPFGLCALSVSALALMKAVWHPIKVPVQANRPGRPYRDPHEIDLCTLKPKPAAGIFFLGNDRKTGKEIWLTNDDIRQHFLLLGSGGSGKTEALIGFGANALNWSSGFLMIDGRGDVSVFAKIYALARRYGREDDLLVLNFMTDGRKRSTNSMNPFATGSSDSLTQMIVSLMDDVGGDGAMWKGRATAMLTGVMRALCWLRDEGLIDLDAATIRDHMNLRKIIDLSDEKQFPDLPQHIRHTIKSYLSSLPGFQPENGYEQAQTTLNQHGYLVMQFTKILGDLARLSNVFATPHGDVDMFDVVMNRRILIVMLPALEKSSAEVANLGKIVVASLKRMMGCSLGSREDGAHDVVLRRLTNSPSPFVAICDEVAHYLTDGMDVMAAQARALGFSMVYSASGLNGMKRLNDKVVGSIIGNTNTRILMRIEDPETAKMAIELAGKAYRSTVGGFTGHSGEAPMTDSDNLEARIDEVERIKFLDMKAQENGQMHVVYKDTIVMAQSFYANPEGSLDKYKLKLRANEFLALAAPTDDDKKRWFGLYSPLSLYHPCTAQP